MTLSWMQTIWLVWAMLHTNNKRTITFSADAFVVPHHSSYSVHNSALHAAPRRLEENVDGVVYVNERCINCAACANFAPSVFARSPTDRYHVVHKQPDLSDEEELDKARAALAACPVAAIRVETEAHRHHNHMPSLTSTEQELAAQMALSPKHNGRPLPFPRPLFQLDHVWFVGHHNEHSFGATPYLTYIINDKKKEEEDKIWILVDTPRFGKSSVEAVTSLTGPEGPDYLLLTHVDDTADHNKWVQEFPNLKRIFHAGDLGRHNWLNDRTLEEVEILLQPNSSNNGDSLTAYSLEGRLLTTQDEIQHVPVVIYHTPGHSPGSISLSWKPSSRGGGGDGGVLFTGDTYALTTRTGTMTAMPTYGNNLQQQAKSLEQLVELPWDVIAPGHGHPRDYSAEENVAEAKRVELQHALDELKNHRKW